MQDHVIANPAPHRRVPWKGEVDGGEAAPATQTRLVNPDETPD